MVNVKYAYCTFCKKEIEEPIKKPLKPMQKTLWVMGCVATLGFGIIAFLIYYYGFKRSVYCPVCISELTFSKEAFEKPKETEAKTPKEKIYKKAGKKIPEKKEIKEEAQLEKEEKVQEEKAKEEDDKIYCPYCGNQIKKNIEKCPHCKSALDDRTKD